jgi:hypothetical protein
MNLDLRIPLGSMFALIGFILTGWGMRSYGNAVFYAKSMGINVNLWWGLVLMAFGIMMLILGRRGQRRAAKIALQAPDAEKKTETRGH